MLRISPPLAGILFLTLLCGGPALAGDPAADAQQKEVKRRLAMTVTFEGIDDYKTTLQDALELIRSRFGLPFEVEEAAFKAEGVEDVLSNPVADLPIPRMTNVKPGTVLDRVLGRLPSTSDATYCVRSGVVVITTRKWLDPAQWQDENWRGPEISLEITYGSLSEALRELADATGVNLLCDGRLTTRRITARLHKVPLATAVHLLANLVGAEAVALENVLLVTTRENATAMRRVEDRGRRLEGGSMSPSPLRETGRIGSGYPQKMYPQKSWRSDLPFPSLVSAFEENGRLKAQVKQREQEVRWLMNTLKETQESTKAPSP